MAQAAILDKIPSFKIAGLHVGDAVKGAVAAGVGDVVATLAMRYLPDNLTSGQYAPVLLRGGMAAFLKWKPVAGFLGKDASDVGSLILTYEAVRTLFDVRTKTYSLLAELLNKVTPATNGNNPATATNDASQVIERVIL